MTDLARFKNQIVSLTFVLQVVAIFDKPDIELVEVGLYVNALQLRIHVLIDEHEVRVDFKAAVFTHSDTNLIFLAFWVSFGHWTILDEWRDRKLSLVWHHAKLYEFKSTLWAFFKLCVVSSKETKLARIDVLEDKRTHFVANLLDCDNLVVFMKVEILEILLLNVDFVAVTWLVLEEWLVHNAILVNVDVDNGVTVSDHKEALQQVDHLVGSTIYKLISKDLIDTLLMIDRLEHVIVYRSVFRMDWLASLKPMVVCLKLWVDLAQLLKNLNVLSLFLIDLMQLFIVHVRHDNFSRVTINTVDTRQAIQAVLAWDDDSLQVNVIVAVDTILESRCWEVKLKQERRLVPKQVHDVDRCGVSLFLEQKVVSWDIPVTNRIAKASLKHHRALPVPNLQKVS